MKSFKGGIIITESEMTKSDVIEMILYILNKITEHTQTLNQVTPSLFDKIKLTPNKNESTAPSSGENQDDSEENTATENEEKFTLCDCFYYWSKKLEFDSNLLVLTMMNIDKLLAKDFILSESNAKNVLSTCMALTQKYYEDETFKDSDYSKLFKIKTNDLIQMEIEFLSLIDYSMKITEKEFNEYKSNLTNMWKQTLSIFSFT